MAIRAIQRSTSRPGGYKGRANAAPIYVDSDDSNKVKVIPGGEDSTTEVEVIDATTTQTISGAKTFSAAGTVYGPALTPGTGFDGAESYEAGVFKSGGLIVTRIVFDLTDLINAATDGDIVGESAAAANCHFGQITAAVNGTIIGGSVTCLEVPAGGADDLDFYAADEGTGAENAAISGLTETALVTSGAAWTSGRTLGMTALPAANQYLYVVAGEAAGGTFTAGKFLVELYGE